MESPMRIRFIEENTPDLPTNFAAIAGRTMAEAVDNIALILERAEQTCINLLVWNGAADLLTPDEKKILTQLVNRQTGYRELGGHRLPCTLSQIFTAISADICTESELAALAAWERTGQEFLQQMDRKYGLQSSVSTVRFDESPLDPALHLDAASATAATAIRTVGNSTTIFVADADILVKRESETPVLRPGMEFFWTSLPWAFCVMMAETTEKSVAHTGPFGTLVTPPGSRRATDMHEIKTRKCIVAPGRN